MYVFLYKLNLINRYIPVCPQIQFVITFTHTTNSVRVGCDFPRWGQYLLIGYMVIMLFLFGNFYVQAYIKRRRLASKPDSLSANREVNREVNGRSRSKHD